MKKIIIFNICILFSLSAFSQKGNNQLFSEYEDTLKVIANKVMNLPFEAEKRIANDALIEYLSEVLSYEKSFNYNFDSLITISRLKSPDKRFRIFNWLLKKDNNTYEYYGIVHYYNKKKKKFELITLIDNSNNIRTPEQENLDATNWYGGLIYDIIYIKKPGKKYYTLLLWDGNDGYSTKKIIDVMYFSGKNKIKFGLPIFKKNAKESQKRIILQYDSKTTVSVKYSNEKKEIIFNNLVPQRKGLEGLYEFYIPEGTFNSYKYKNGKWWLKEDVDVRIKQKIKKYKKPKRGLSPK
ncbi:MAG: hypothetical protein P8P82_02595 [Flavobacteriales bacterium]|nr:hypothetical protein [Flavobacteriales bacterium]MDG2086013.1 hypothetical protein [Flavobacteriales bacterium]